jgi:hypothetical protein
VVIVGPGVHTLSKGSSTSVVHNECVPSLPPTRMSLPEVKVTIRVCEKNSESKTSSPEVMDGLRVHLASNVAKKMAINSYENSGIISVCNRQESFR